MHAGLKSLASRSRLFTRKCLFLVLLTVGVWHGWLTPMISRSLAAESLVDQASELLRQQITTWQTPPRDTETPESPSALPLTNSPQVPATTDVSQTASEAPPPAPLAEQSVKPIPPKSKLMVGSDILRAAVMLSRFYEERGYRLAWSNEEGPRPQAENVVEAIQTEAAREGLQAGAYRLAQLRKRIQEARGAAQPALDPRPLADLDLLLTDTFLTYGAHLSVGKTNLDVMDMSWFEARQKTDLVQALQKALDSDNIENVLHALAPQHPGYLRLRDALARYRNLAAHGGWPRIPPGFDLHPGEHDERIPILRARLSVTGDLKEADPVGAGESSSGGRRAAGKTGKKKVSEKDAYDLTLVQAVKAFQRRHGLTPDGVVGGATLAALNVSVDTRIAQLLMNMDRWRSLPSDLGRRYIAVNIPDFTLQVMDNDQPFLRMKVVVGKMVEKRNTPTFTAKMTHLVLNPYWNVPKSIAEEELFPLSRKNPRYFAEHKFIVRRVEVGEKQASAANAPGSSTGSTKVYKYLLKQAPGPKNALGQVKFMFPNPYGIYLHDTPSKELFNRSIRTYSHGCIRVEKPLDLAEYLLRDNIKWTREAISSTINQQKEKTVWLPEAVPVYIQYWTAWVNADGVIEFRNDIYGYDNEAGAQLPVTFPKNARPAPTPAEQPTLQETQPTPSELPAPHRSAVPSATPATQPSSSAEAQRLLQP